LVHIDQFDIGGVAIQLRHPVNECGDPRVGRASANPAEEGIAQRPCREFIDEYVGA
jgi:hypothetical protein